MATERESKRIVSVVINREVDTDPDFSWLGEYSDTPEDYAIVATGEHKGEFESDHLPCECSHGLDAHKEIESGYAPCGECDCEDCSQITIERGREWRYFNSGSIDSGNTPEENRTYAMQDFKRMDSYNRLDWCFLGISAVAEVQVNGSTVQRIRSGGLWGIESDSDESYLRQVEQEQLDELKDQLHAIGFSKRAMTAAFRDIRHEDV